ncbi:MAG: mannose-6-phosphate isomerase-like protein (cupin superfamily) [Pseudohongiellaceae bacterium]|jgi:mannose-6-phosphate isomerase-like protein (cupin superfamily)
MTLAATQSALVVLPCKDLAATLAWFVEQLGFRLERIAPADDPARALISGFGLQIELLRGDTDDGSVLRLLCEDPVGKYEALQGGVGLGAGTRSVSAPNGTRVDLCEASPPLQVPRLKTELVHTSGADAHWVTGRAGMGYRDLIPGRLGGRFIASQIRIVEAGPVPDSVHFHQIRIQLIYCVAGWVRVAYEDQGDDLVMEAGDCVLQPPGIRHRVLESSADLQVIEVGCPAEHDTWLDHELALPTGQLRPQRDFGGQRFVHHVAASAPWSPWRGEGFEQQCTAIAAATDGLARVCSVRCLDEQAVAPLEHDGELLFFSILNGAVSWHCEGRDPLRLEQGDSLVVPAGLSSELLCGTSNLRMLEVWLPEMASPS